MGPGFFVAGFALCLRFWSRCLSAQAEHLEMLLAARDAADEAALDLERIRLAFHAEHMHERS